MGEEQPVRKRTAKVARAKLDYKEIVSESVRIAVEIMRDEGAKPSERLKAAEYALDQSGVKEPRSVVISFTETAKKFAE